MLHSEGVYYCSVCVATVTDSCLYQENHFLVESRCRTELNTAVLFITSVHTATVTVHFIQVMVEWRGKFS